MQESLRLMDFLLLGQVFFFYGKPFYLSRHKQKYVKIHLPSQHMLHLHSKQYSNMKVFPAEESLCDLSLISIFVVFVSLKEYFSFRKLSSITHPTHQMLHQVVSEWRPTSFDLSIFLILSSLLGSVHNFF